MGENEPRQMSWLVFRNSPPGLPHFMGPLDFLPPWILHRTTVKPPASLWKGEGLGLTFLASEEAEVM